MSGYNYYWDWCDDDDSYWLTEEYGGSCETGQLVRYYEHEDCTDTCAQQQP